jgi:hypothetical protein
MKSQPKLNTNYVFDFVESLLSADVIEGRSSWKKFVNKNSNAP